MIFGEVMTELRLLHLVEKKVGYDALVRLIEYHLGTVTFDRCATSSEPISLLHNALVSTLED